MNNPVTITTWFQFLYDNPVLRLVLPVLIVKLFDFIQDRYKERHQESTDTNDKLWTEMQDNKKRTESLEAQNAALVKEHAAQRQLDIARVATLEQRDLENTRTISRLETQNQALIQSNADQSARIHQLEAQDAVRIQQMSDLKSERDSLLRTLEATNSQLAQAQQRIRELEGHIRNLEQRISQ